MPQIPPAMVESQDEHMIAVLGKPGLDAEMLQKGSQPVHTYVDMTVEGRVRQLNVSHLISALPGSTTEQFCNGSSILKWWSVDAFGLLDHWMYRGLPENGDHSKDPAAWSCFAIFIENWDMWDLSAAINRKLIQLTADVLASQVGAKTVNIRQIQLVYDEAGTCSSRFIMVHMLVLWSDKFCLPNGFLGEFRDHTLNSEMALWGSILRRLPQAATCDPLDEIQHAVEIANTYLMPIIAGSRRERLFWPERLFEIFGHEGNDRNEIRHQVIMFLGL